MPLGRLFGAGSSRRFSSVSPNVFTLYRLSLPEKRILKAILLSGYFLELDTARSAGIPMGPRAVLPGNTRVAHQTFHDWFKPTHEAAAVAPSVSLAFI